MGLSPRDAAIGLTGKVGLRVDLRLPNPLEEGHRLSQVETSPCSLVAPHAG
jgi:hypothetical protein